MAEFTARFGLWLALSAAWILFFALALPLSVPSWVPIALGPVCALCCILADAIARPLRRVLDMLRSDRW